MTNSCFILSQYYLKSYSVVYCSMHPINAAVFITTSSIILRDYYFCRISICSIVCFFFFLKSTKMYCNMYYVFIIFLKSKITKKIIINYWIRREQRESIRIQVFFFFNMLSRPSLVPSMPLLHNMSFHRILSCVSSICTIFSLIICNSFFTTFVHHRGTS